MNNPYNADEYAKCAGCFMEIYFGEEFLEFLQPVEQLKRSVYQKVHNEFGCLVNATGAIETLEAPKNLNCEGCSLEILPEHAPYLVFTWNGKTLYVHNDFDCLKAAVNTRLHIAGKKLRSII